jgi:hypothetical protein
VLAEHIFHVYNTKLESQLYGLNSFLCNYSILYEHLFELKGKPYLHDFHEFQKLAVCLVITQFYRIHQVIATMIISLHDHPIGASDKEMSKWVLGNITHIHDKMHRMKHEFNRNNSKVY